MKFLIVSLALIAVAAAQQHAQQPPIAILRQSQDVSPDGAYNYQYETQNGIVMAERGALGPASAIAAQGQFQYTAPDGTPIAVSYTADENGFQPQGAHLPVAPPIPEAILRSLEHNAAHPEENDSQPPQQQFNRRF